MKKILAICLLLCLLLAACGGQTEGPVQSDPPASDPEPSQQESLGMDYSTYGSSLRLLVYNIYYKDVDRRAANIQDLILKNDPDVLMLQEVSVSWIPYIQQFMADNGYSYYGYGRYGGEMSAGGLDSGDQFVPILWKTEKYDLVESGHFWLSSTPQEVKSAAWVDGTISKYPRCVNWVILKDKTTGGEFFAMNIHTDPESDIVRTNSCQLAVEKMNELSGGRPVVVGGDWNMGITDTGYRILTESGFPDVRIQAGDTELGGSFNAWGERADDNFAYGDHVFMSRDMAAQKFSVVNDYYDDEHISDHNPLLAILYY